MTIRRQRQRNVIVGLVLTLLLSTALVGASTSLATIPTPLNATIEPYNAANCGTALIQTNFESRTDEGWTVTINSISGFYSGPQYYSPGAHSTNAAWGITPYVSQNAFADISVSRSVTLTAGQHYCIEMALHDGYSTGSGGVGSSGSVTFGITEPGQSEVAVCDTTGQIATWRDCNVTYVASVTGSYTLREHIVESGRPQSSYQHAAFDEFRLTNFTAAAEGATQTAIANQTATVNAAATQTANANASATANAAATQTANANATATANAGTTQTANANLTATANANATATSYAATTTAAPAMTGTALAATGTANANLTATVNVATATANANLTATANALTPTPTATSTVNGTATANAGTTQTANAAATQTANANLTATTNVGATQTANANLTATANAIASHTPTSTATQTATTAASTTSPTGNPIDDTVRIQLRYRASNTNPSDGELAPVMELRNIGDVAVDYKDLTIRYWYTADGDGAERIGCEALQMACANVLAASEKLPRAVDGADHMVVIGFNNQAGKLAPDGSSGDIRLRVVKLDGSNFDERDDYSFDPTKQVNAEWQRVTVYYRGVLIAGVEPSGLPQASPTTTTTRTPTPIAQPFKLYLPLVTTSEWGFLLNPSKR